MSDKPETDAVIQTLATALDALLEARDDSGIDDRVPVVFLTPDGVEYVLGMFELCEQGTADERLVVDLQRRREVKHPDMQTL